METHSNQGSPRQFVRWYRRNKNTLAEAAAPLAERCNLHARMILMNSGCPRPLLASVAKDFAELADMLSTRK